MTLTRAHEPLQTVAGLLAAALPDRFRVDTEGTEFTPGTVALDVVTAPVPQWFRMGGPDKASMLVQVTVRDTTRGAARLAGDEVRHVLTAVTTKGKPLHPLTRPGYRFDVPATTGDSHLDTTQGVHTHTETFRITWQ